MWASPSASRGPCRSRSRVCRRPRKLSPNATRGCCRSRPSPLRRSRRSRGRYLAWLDGTGRRVGGRRRHVRRPSLGHGVDGRNGPQPLRSSRWRGVPGRGIAATEPGRERSCRRGGWPEGSDEGGVRLRWARPTNGSAWAGRSTRASRWYAPCSTVADAVLGEDRGASLLDAMFGGPDAEGGLSDPAWARPATYALGCALTALWASVGIRPSVVAGQSVGEIAAAQAAGVFGLEDGLRLAAAGGRRG